MLNSTSSGHPAMRTEHSKSVKCARDAIPYTRLPKGCLVNLSRLMLSWKKGSFSTWGNLAGHRCVTENKYGTSVSQTGMLLNFSWETIIYVWSWMKQRDWRDCRTETLKDFTFIFLLLAEDIFLLIYLNKEP